MLSLSLPSANGEAEAADTDGFAPNAFIRIESDGQIVLTMPYVEMGQGTYTSIPMLNAEELEVDLKRLCHISGFYLLLLSSRREPGYAIPMP